MPGGRPSAEGAGSGAAGPVSGALRRRTLNIGYRLDIILEASSILDIKAVAALTDLHKAQLLFYLRLSGHRLILLLDFNVVRMRDGIVRVIDGRERAEGHGSRLRDPRCTPCPL